MEDKYDLIAAVLVGGAVIWFINSGYYGAFKAAIQSVVG